MCYSALVRQDLHVIARRFGAAIAFDLFAQLFRRRAGGEDIKLSRALEQNFQNPQSELERRIKTDIDSYRARCASQWERELFAQKQRLADAQRILQGRQSRKSQEDVRIATRKIAAIMERLGDLHRLEAQERDSRIFPLTYAPVVARVHDKLQILPMRYTCRLAGKPASHDARFPGTYNARRDNLEGFWDAVYGRHHALLVVSSFYENVPLHLYEHRPLQPGERPGNLLLRFDPRPASDMLIACLWDRWGSTEAEELWSFAAVTDEPPPQIAATGHQRCVIALKPEHAQTWLSPQTAGRERLAAVLADRQIPRYEHRIAA